MNILLISLDHPKNWKRFICWKMVLKFRPGSENIKAENGWGKVGRKVRKDSCKTVHLDITGPLLSGICSSSCCLSETWTNLSQSTFQQRSGKGPWDLIPSWVAMEVIDTLGRGISFLYECGLWHMLHWIFPHPCVN